MNGIQKNVLRVTSVILALITLYYFRDFPSNFKNSFEYFFDFGLETTLNQIYWVISTPILLGLTIAFAVFTLRAHKYTLYLGALLIILRIFTFLFYFVINAFMNNFDFSYVNWFMRSWFIGFGGIFNKAIVFVENLTALTILIIVFISLLTSKRNSDRSTHIAFEPLVAAPAQFNPPVATGNPTHDLAELAKMYEAGHLTDAEFKAAKKKILG